MKTFDPDGPDSVFIDAQATLALAKWLMDFPEVGLPTHLLTVLLTSGAVCVNTEVYGANDLSRRTRWPRELREFTESKKLNFVRPVSTTRTVGHAQCPASYWYHHGTHLSGAAFDDFLSLVHCDYDDRPFLLSPALSEPDLSWLDIAADYFAPIDDMTGTQADAVQLPPTRQGEITLLLIQTQIPHLWRQSRDREATALAADLAPIYDDLIARGRVSYSLNDLIEANRAVPGTSVYISPEELLYLLKDYSGCRTLREIVARCAAIDAAPDEINMLVQHEWTRLAQNLKMSDVAFGGLALITWVLPNIAAKAMKVGLEAAKSLVNRRIERPCRWLISMRDLNCTIAEQANEAPCEEDQGR